MCYRTALYIYFFTKNIFINFVFFNEFGAVVAYTQSIFNYLLTFMSSRCCRFFLDNLRLSISTMNNSKSNFLQFLNFQYPCLKQEHTS